MSPAQAAAIVAGLEAVPDTVPVEDLAVAEQQLVGLGRHFSPSELRKAARRARDLLDADGPAPEEDKAYAREELRVRTADRGVKFSGYLANENAELFQALILSGSKPRKTVTGELDPRSPDKRRADALTDILNVASNAIDLATAPTTRPTRPGQPWTVPRHRCRSAIAPPRVVPRRWPGTARRRTSRSPSTSKT